MLKKIVILTIGYFFFGVLLFSACEGFLKYDSTICDIQFSGLQSDWNPSGDAPDTFGDRIGFKIVAIESSPTCYFPAIQVFNSAYATTKCADYQNQLLTSTYQISFDRPFVLNNDTIEHNTDLLGVSEIKALTEIDIEAICNLVSSTIIFKPELIDQIEFEAGEYLVTFKCSTSDNRDFLKKRKVVFQE